MDQTRLRSLEETCIQEQPPQCQAACPLHVDARALVGHIAQGRWSDAWKTLRKNMPFPGILGRLCDGPCQPYCKRAEAGEPICIASLEKATVCTPAPNQRVLPLPRKSKTVAIVGAGLAGLTVAWDLCRKGYPVTVLEPETDLGMGLYKAFADRLPQGIVEQETEILARLGVTVRLKSQVESAGFLEDCLAEFDVVFLSLDAMDSAAWPVEREDNGYLKLDSLTRASSMGRVFAGGSCESPVWEAAQGRFAATSMDRLLQGVSLTAQRGNEGPFETRLYTSLTDIAPLDAVPMADPEAGYSEEEAINEAQRCIQCECLECVKTCSYLAAYKGYPKKYARFIYNNESIVKGHRQANKLINSCMLCGQCTVICPNDFPMAELCLETRQSMVRRNLMPPSAHDFALEDLRFNQGPHFKLTRNAPGESASDILFFPGCQLSGSDPDLVERLYAWMRETLPGKVGIALGCCGAPALWSGRSEWFAETLDALEKERQVLGAPLVVTACSTCHHVFSQYAPDTPERSLWEMLDEQGLPDAARTLPESLALHDPCTTRSHNEVQEAVRRILGRLGQEVHELPYSRELTACCGYGGLLYNANPDLAQEIAARRAGEDPADYAAYCAMCRDRLTATGKRTLHVLDLLFPAPDMDDPAGKQAVTFSQRHENRARLKRRLLKTLWNEEPAGMKKYEAIELYMSPETQALCEKRLILKEDLQRVILHAEQSGRKMLNPETGRSLAYHQPVRVTYWVEYEPEGSGFRVHNAYSHRMTIPGGQSS